jgi:hypothetical protein
VYPVTSRGALKRAVSSLHPLAVLVPPDHVRPRLPIGSQASSVLTSSPIGTPKFSALADWVLYLGPFPNTRLTHRPDDGGSKDLWNVGTLLPDYTVLQPRRQPSSNWPVVCHTSFVTFLVQWSYYWHFKTVWENACVSWVITDVG